MSGSLYIYYNKIYEKYVKNHLFLSLFPNFYLLYIYNHRCLNLYKSVSSQRDKHREGLDTNTYYAALPFGFQFLAGAIAGVSEILVMYPLDGKK